MTTTLQVSGWVLLAAGLVAAIAIGIANPRRANFAIRAGTGLWILPFMLTVGWKPEWSAAMAAASPVAFFIVYALAPARFKGRMHHDQIPPRPNASARERTSAD